MDRRLSWVFVLGLAVVVVAGSVSCRGRSTRGGHTAGPRSAPVSAQSQSVHPHQLLTGETKATATRGPQLSTIVAEPMMRIRVQRQATNLSLSGGPTLTIGPGHRDNGRANPRSFAAPVAVRHDGSGFILTDARGAAMRWPLSSLHIKGTTGELAMGDNRFPGEIELVALYEEGRYTGYFDVVNHVGMESYLPGVLSQEMYPKWDIKAYQAQAIAARSYAIWEMNLPVRKSSHFDLEAGEASQAYIGSKAHATARSAVSSTRGKVLAYDNRVLPAFYSSCSGGASQDATAAFPGRVENLAPLRGKPHGAWGQASTKFTWGPVTYPKARLIAGMRAWGQKNKHPVAGLNSIRAIEPTGKNAAGRPTGYVVIDESGRRFEMNPEQLRVAANTPVPGDTASTNLRLWSGYVTASVGSSSVSFSGRGFGHGVGMCQFGAQGMAVAGQPHSAILGFYYPGASIVRAY